MSQDSVLKIAKLSFFLGSSQMGKWYFCRKSKWFSSSIYEWLIWIIFWNLLQTSSLQIITSLRYNETGQTPSPSIFKHRQVSVDFFSAAKVHTEPGTRNSVTLSSFRSPAKGRSMLVNHSIIFLDAPDQFCLIILYKCHTNKFQRKLLCLDGEDTNWKRLDHQQLQNFWLI